MSVAAESSRKCASIMSRLTELSAATDIPVNADYEGGYADAPDGVAANVKLCVDTGVAGLSIEDSTGNKDKPLYDIPFAVERMKAARAAIDKAAPDVLLTGRAEGFIAGVPDLEQMIARLKAYSAAGADVLYAPGLRRADEIRAVCEAVSRPVNVLAVSDLSFAEIAEAGAQRVSVGGALAWVAVKAMADAAAALREGDLSALAARVPLEDWLGAT